MPVDQGGSMRQIVMHNLRMRLLLLVGAAFVPVLLLLLVLGGQQRQQFLEEARAESLRLARVGAAAHQEFLAGGEQLLEGLARLPAVREGPPTTCSALLAGVLSQHPQYLNLGVADREGQVYCSALPMEGAVSIADRAYFRRALQTGEPALGEYQVGRITGRPSINLGYPLTDDAVTLSGVIFAALDLSWMDRLAEQAELPQGSLLTVLDDQGTILALRPEAAGRVGGLLADEELRRRLGDVEETLISTGPDAVARLFAIMPLRVGDPVPDAYLLVGVPTAVILAPANQLLGRSLIWLLIISLFFLVGAWLAGDVLIVRPIASLHRAARAWSEGDLSARTGLPHGGGELNQLAGALDGMAGRLAAREAELRDLNAQLEARVGQRTMELEAERTTLDEVLASVRDGLLVFSPQMEVLYVNASLGELLDLDWEGLVGQPAKRMWEAAGPVLADAQAAQEAARKAWDRVEEHPSFDVPLAGDPPRKLRVTAFPVGESGERRIGFTVRDVTLEERQEQQRLAEERSETIELLAARFAHEILNPLGALMNDIYHLRTRLVAGRPVGDAQLRRLEREARRMERLVRDLQAYAEPPRPQWSEVDLAELSREVAEELELPFDVQVELDLASVPPITGDPTYLRQVMLNLVQNAQEAMPRGGRLTLTTRAEGAEVLLQVTDEGEGIEPGALPRLFQALYTTKSSGGFGLGLAATHNIVEVHRGRIDVESQPGEGTTFTLRFPART